MSSVMHCKMMQILNSILILLWLPQIHAQYGGQISTAEATTTTTTSSPTSTSAASAIQTVNVGEHGFTFDPDTLTVSPGHTVEFHFYPGNHSVVEAAFSNPCHPLSETSFFSGFVPATNGESSMVFTLTVNDTNPIWFYCGQIGHCQAGMVGVINPPGSSSDTLSAFKAAASMAGLTTVPATVHGGVWGTASNESTSGSSTSASTTTSTSNMPTSAATTSTSSEAQTMHAWTDLSIISILSLMVAAWIL